ncbi:MAG: oligosaccharide flippase family protein, partial [Myxococcota bacterium]
MSTPPTPSAGRGGNLLALAITQVVITATGLALQIGLARVLGDESYGSYRFLAMLAGMFGFLADFSIPTLLARQVARDESSAAERLGTGLGAIALLALVPIGLTVAYTAFADGRAWMIVAAVAAGSTMGALASRGVTESIFQGLRRMQPLVLANAIGRVVYLVGVVAALSVGAGIAGVFAAAAAGPIVSAGVLLVRFVRDVGRPIVPSLNHVTTLIRDGVPFGLHRAFMGLYLAGDLLVIQAFWGEAELGAYGVATLLLIQLPVADVLVRAAYPTLAQAVGSPDRAGEILGRLLRLLLTLGLPIAVGGLWVAPDLIPAVFGPDYATAIPLFCVVLWVLPLRFANGAASGALAALDRQPTRTRAIIAIALFNL